MTPEELTKYDCMIKYEGSERNPLFLYGIECGPGWMPLIIELLDKVLLLNTNNNIHLFQIKEKFGNFRFYYDYVGTDKDESNRIKNEIDLYTTQINSTCEQCGQPGTVKLIRRWYRASCESCAAKRA